VKRWYEHHVREGLAELASEEEQRRLWLATEGEVSSFLEAVSQVYDDAGVEDLFDKGDAEAELGHDTAHALRTLGFALRSVDEGLPPADLIASDEMGRVRVLATSALRTLPEA
jgi:hypothetical protein